MAWNIRRHSAVRITVLLTTPWRGLHYIYYELCITDFVEVLPAGLCRDAGGKQPNIVVSIERGVDARDTASSALCKLECEKYASCVAVTFSKIGKNSCTMHGAKFDATNVQDGWTFRKGTGATDDITRTLNVANAHCYRKELGTWRY